MVYEYFRPTGSYDEIQGLSGLLSNKMEDDDIQGFDVRWEQALLLTSDPPSDKVFEGLYASNCPALPGVEFTVVHLDKRFHEGIRPHQTLCLVVLARAPRHRTLVRGTSATALQPTRRHSLDRRRERRVSDQTRHETRGSIIDPAV